MPLGIRRPRIARDIVEAMRRPHLIRDVVDHLRSTGVAESVIGTDDRVRVFDTTQFPYSAIASLEITDKTGVGWLGTGWFISPRTLLTAGHVVFIRDAEDPDAEGWVSSIRVIPGRNGTGPNSEPFGNATSVRFRAATGWVNPDAVGANDGKVDFYDIGAILLDQPIGEDVGTFSLGVFGQQELLDARLNIAGYPADKTGADEATLWFDANKPVRATMSQSGIAGKIFYTIDTFGGQSGAPIFVVEPDGSRTAVGVHAYGIGNGITSNSGTRLTDTILNTVQSWMA
jgi:V8-like Glu-specific endopeptidase